GLVKIRNGKTARQTSFSAGLRPCRKSVGLATPGNAAKIGHGSGGEQRLPSKFHNSSFRNLSRAFMQSPFKIFRKHQKVVLAGLTLMAMIGFGLGDTLIKMVKTGPSQRAAKIAVETNIGNLTQSQMSMLMYRRTTIHRFIDAAYEASHP